MITIEVNDYKQDTSVRDEVVQSICEIFLNNKEFHPFDDGQGNHRNATVYIEKRFGSDVYNDFTDKQCKYYDSIRFNTAEMKKSFEVLISKKYHMFRYVDRINGITYVCSKKPFMFGAEEVFEYNDFID